MLALKNRYNEANYVLFCFLNMSFLVEACMSQTVQLDNVLLQVTSRLPWGGDRAGNPPGAGLHLCSHPLQLCWDGQAEEQLCKMSLLFSGDGNILPTSHCPPHLGSKVGGGSIWCLSVIYSSKVNCLPCWSLDLALVISEGWLYEKVI